MTETQFVLVVFKKLFGVHPIAESDSVVCFPPWSQAPQCASHHKVNCTKFLKKLRGVHHTAELSSVVCITLESNCTLQSQNRNICESLVGLKGTEGRNLLSGEHILHKRKDLKKIVLIF